MPIAGALSRSALAAAVLAAGCGAGSLARTEYLRAVTKAEAPLEDALRRFEAVADGADRSAAKDAAGQVLEQAKAARESLEALAVPPALTTARREELVFLNHVVPAFQGFAAGGASPGELETLRSILQRGRTHQKRGRDAAVSR